MCSGMLAAKLCCSLSIFIPCLSGCHPHPLYVGCGVEWLGRGTKRGWMSRSVKTFRFRGRFLSSSDFSRMARPVPPKLLAMSPLPLTPSFTRAIGSTLDVVGVGDNRIGTKVSKTLRAPFFFSAHLERHFRSRFSAMNRGVCDHMPVPCSPPPRRPASHMHFHLYSMACRSFMQGLVSDFSPFST